MTCRRSSAPAARRQDASASGSSCAGGSISPAFPPEERADRLRQQTDAGHPESDTTSGLVAYVDGQPVGWCAVEPRSHYEGLLRNNRVPWQGRKEDKADDSVWAVTCFFIRRGFAGAASAA